MARPPMPKSSAHPEQPRSQAEQSRDDPYLVWLDGPGGDELEAIERAREADGQPWWAERFGDLVAPDA